MFIRHVNGSSTIFRQYLPERFHLIFFCYVVATFTAFETPETSSLKHHSIKRPCRTRTLEVLELPVEAFLIGKLEPQSDEK